MNTIIFTKPVKGKDDEVYVFLYPDGCQGQILQTFLDLARRSSRTGFTWEDAKYLSRRVRRKMEKQDKKKWGQLDRRIQGGLP